MSSSKEFSTYASQDKPTYITHPEYTPKESAYGFFTRDGGKSTGAYSSLNVGIATKDARENIVENIRIAFEKIQHSSGKPLETGWLFINKTTYSNKVLAITRENIDALKREHAFTKESGFEGLNNFCTRIKADGFVTNSPEAILGTVGADAHSIVLIDEKSGVAGIMAGSWKGIAKGLYENVIDEMVKLGARKENIVTILGPGLAKESYEFDSHLNEKNPNNSGAFYSKEPRLDAADSNIAYKPKPEYERFFPLLADNQTKCHVDMAGLIAYKAQEQGLSKVFDSAIDTKKDVRVFGARRDTGPAPKHLDTGRNLNFVSLLAKQESKGSGEQGQGR